MISEEADDIGPTREGTLTDRPHQKIHQIVGGVLGVTPLTVRPILIGLA